MGGKMNVCEALDVLIKTVGGLEGDRHIVVLDRGWIFVGNLSKREDGTYVLVNAKNVRKWQRGGFGALSKGAKLSEATLDDAAPIIFTDKALLFTVPVAEDWDD